MYTVRKSAEYFAITDLSFSFSGFLWRFHLKLVLQYYQKFNSHYFKWIYTDDGPYKKALERWIEDNMTSFLIKWNLLQG